jgi:hypothetical protein
MTTVPKPRGAAAELWRNFPTMPSVHAVDSSTPDATDHCSVAAPDDSGPRWARFLGDATGLLAVEVSTPVLVALALVDLLNRFGVTLTAYKVDNRHGWARQRLSLTERDGTLVRGERRLRLEAEVLTLLAETERS